jgi:hypothetical protein
MKNKSSYGTTTYIVTRNDDNDTLLWATLIGTSKNDDATPKNVAKKEILTNLYNNLPKCSRQNSNTKSFEGKKVKKWLFQTQLFPINEDELGPCCVQG